MTRSGAPGAHHGLALWGTSANL